MENVNYKFVGIDVGFYIDKLNLAHIVYNG